jgi:hypothetical protein
MSNVYKAGDVGVIIEVSNTEHPDGAITGRLLKQCGPADDAGGFPARPCGTFRIDADGSIKRGPAIFRACALAALARGRVVGIGSGGLSGRP